MDQIAQQLEQFFDLDLTSGDEIIFTEQAKTLIHDIADKCRKTPQYELYRSQTNKNEFETPEDVYRLLLKYEDQNFPAEIYLFPILDDMLERRNFYENHITGQKN